jgi:putative spermidine/putrescine transport system substrate-binding protein
MKKRLVNPLIALRLNNMPATLFLLMILVGWPGCKETGKGNAGIEKASWAQIEQQGRGARITMMMFQGDKKVNAYMSGYVIPELKKRYDIILTIVPGQGKEIVSNQMSEKEAGKSMGEIDLCWINGETFYQLRQIDALFGPYTDRLPNSRYVDYSNPIIRYDFQQEVNGYETPWGESFYYFIYDSARLRQPPMNMHEFASWWKSHPGRFTLSNDFSGMTLLKTWLVELAGGMQEMDGRFDREKYTKYSAQLWKWINDNKKNFWKNGETFPASITNIAQMYSSGELDLSMSFNDAEIDNKVAEGLFPPTSKAYILQPGSIHNTHYVGIAAASGHKAAAMLVCNFLISPEAQAKKSDIRLWGSRTVLAMDKLEPTRREAFNTLPRRRYGLNNDSIKSRAIKELAPEYMISIFDDFRTKVINE